MKNRIVFMIIMLLCFILCSCGTANKEAFLYVDTDYANHDERTTSIQSGICSQFRLIGNSFNLATDYCAVVNNGFYRLTNKADGAIALIYYDFISGNVEEKQLIGSSQEVTDTFLTSDGNSLYIFLNKVVHEETQLQILVLSSAGKIQQEYTVKHYGVSSHSKVALYGEDLVFSCFSTKDSNSYRIVRLCATTGETDILMTSKEKEEIRLVDVAGTKLCMLTTKKDAKQDIIAYEIITIDMETGENESVMSFHPNELQGIFSEGNLYYFREKELIIHKLDLSTKEELIWNKDISEIAMSIGASQVVLDNNVRDNKVILGFYDTEPLLFMAMDTIKPDNLEEVPMNNEPIVAETDDFFILWISGAEALINDTVVKNGITEEVTRVEPVFAMIPKVDYWYGKEYKIFCYN